MKNPFQFSYVKISLRDKILFVKHLSIAVKSGMTLLSAVQMVRSQNLSKSFKKLLDSILIDLDNGVFLSTSLEKYHNIFGDLFINLVRVGEASGTLSENLSYLADELEKQDVFRRKLRSAMIYPVIVLIATGLVTTLLMVFLVPRLLPVFANMKVELPLPTRILLYTSNAFSAYGLWILAGLAALAVAIVFLLKIKTVRYLWHKSFLYLPILHSVTIEVNMASISRTLGILLKSGIRIVEAINITSQVIPNLVYRRELEMASLSIQKGEFVSKSLESRPDLFPSTFTNLVSVGEHTGNLIDNLKYLNEFYENEVDDFTQNISSVIEPLLLLVLGFTVGFIALATILPIYSITKGL